MSAAPWTPDQRTLEWVADRLHAKAIGARKAEGYSDRQQAIWDCYEYVRGTLGEDVRHG